jgi:elongation factor Ts
MAASASVIKELREKSGAGVMECKKALEEAGGDMAKAQEILKAMSAATASKKASRATGQGRVEAYIHPPGRIGVLLELRCESDFVANSDEFRTLARDLCMQVAACSPVAIRREQIPAQVVDYHKSRFAEEVAGKPPAVQEKMLEGKLKGFYKEVALLEQPYIRDTKVSVEDYIKTKIGILKENITVARFVRVTLGGDVIECLS